MILENEFLKLEINLMGAELKSVYHKMLQKEILYEGKSSFWNRSSPVLFPIIGRLKENQYKYEGKTYTLPQHGFARDRVFELENKTDNSLSFVLQSDVESRIVFPNDFLLRIRYELLFSTVRVSYDVENPSNQKLLFSIGAHPGFTCPVFDSESIDDYFVRFEKDESAIKSLLDSSTGLFSGESEEVEFANQKLQLSDQLFTSDALVFKNLKSRIVSLENNAGTYKLSFSFPDFPYFALWSKPGAPFICLEPWCGLADSNDSTGELSDKEGIISLNAKSNFERNYTFEVWTNAANE